MKKFLAILITASLFVPTLALAACPPDAQFCSDGSIPNPSTSGGPAVTNNTTGAPDPSTIQPIDTSGISQQSLSQANANVQQALQQLSETGQQVGCSTDGQLGGALASAVGASLQGLQGGIVNKLGSLGQGVIGQIAAKAGPFSGFVSKLGNVLLNKGLGYVNTALGGLVDKAVSSITSAFGGAAQSAVQSAVQGITGAVGAGAAAGATAAGAAAGAGVGLAVPVIGVSLPTIDSNVSSINAHAGKIEDYGKTTKEGTEILVKKECILDPTVKALINSVLARTTGAILDMFNNGCNGGACFVTQLKGFLHDVAGATLARAEDEVLSGICSPQRQGVQAAILTQYQFETNYGARTQCSTDNGQNTRRAQGDFIGGGGWDGYIKCLDDPGCGFGSYANGLSVVAEQQAENQANEIKQLDWGKGCKSKVTCNTNADAQLVSSQGVCLDGFVTIPGSLICDQESQALDRANQELLNSHEIGEIVDSFFSSLQSVAFSSIDGLFSLSKKSSNGGGSYLDNLVGQSQQTGGTAAQNTLASDIQGSIAVEQAYGDTLSLVVQDLNKAKTTYTQVAACYQPLTNGGNLTVSSSMALEAVTHATTTIQTVITPQLNDLNRQIKDSDDAVALLTVIRDKATNATSVATITEATTQFNQLMNSGLIHNTTDLQYLENNLASVGNALERLLQEGTGLLAVCKGP